MVPLLFLIFINNIRFVITFCSRLLYADDLQIYINSDTSTSKLSQAKETLEVGIRSIFSWSLQNHLITNPEKNKLILFGPSLLIKQMHDSGFSIQPDTNSITPSFFVKNLGITLDSDLSSNSYITNLIKSVNYTLYRLRHFQNVTNQDLRKKLVVALIFPHLDYCSSATGVLSEAKYDVLQKILNSCAIYVCLLGYRDHVTSSKLSFGWFSIRNRRLSNSLCYLYNLIETGIPQYNRQKVFLHIN